MQNMERTEKENGVDNPAFQKGDALTKCEESCEQSTASTIELTDIYDKQISSAELEPSHDSHGLRLNSNATSDFDGFLHVVKSSLGTGVLAMADGFKNGGLVFGVIGSIVVGLLCTHCSYIMVKSSQSLCKTTRKPFLGYLDTITSAFDTGGNQRFMKWSAHARKAVAGFMFFTYYGVNVSYVLLIAASLQQVVEYHFHLNLNIRYYILVVSLPLFPVGMVRQMKYLVPFSAMANVFLLIGFSITFYYCVTDLPPLSDRRLISPISQLPLFFSTVLFGMEGIGTILPIENSLRNPKHFLGCPGILNLAMVVVVSLFTSIGFTGYLKFGDAALGSVTLNLPSDEILAESVKVLVALAVLFTYGLQFTASVDVVWTGVKDKFAKDKQDQGYYIVRGLMIVGTVLIGLAVPNLAPVISLIGAIGFSMLGFLFPAVAETLVVWEHGFGLWNWILCKNIFLCVVTIGAMISGSIVSVSDIIHQYS